MKAQLTRTNKKNNSQKWRDAKASPSPEARKDRSPTTLGTKAEPLGTASKAKGGPTHGEAAKQSMNTSGPTTSVASAASKCVIPGS